MRARYPGGGSRRTPKSTEQPIRLTVRIPPMPDDDDTEVHVTVRRTACDVDQAPFALQPQFGRGGRRKGRRRGLWNGGEIALLLGGGTGAGVVAHQAAPSILSVHIRLEHFELEAPASYSLGLILVLGLLAWRRRR
jgi:hypothetical protein